MRHFPRHLPTLALLASAVVAWGQLAEARERGTISRITSGREAEILQLLEPFGDMKEIVGGWRVVNVQIPETHIRYALAGPDDETATLLLKHASDSDSDETTLNFRLERQGAPTARAALDLLADAIRQNDQSRFWPTVSEAKGHQSREVAWASARPHAAGFLSSVVSVARDGVVIGFLALLFVLVHLRRVLRDAPWWVPWALLGLLVVGALLRLELSPETTMNAWPYRRNPPLVRLVMSGGVMQWVTRRFGLAIHLTDAIHRIDLVVASLTPLVFFAHARFVMKSWKPALFAAGLLVVLPVHLHFARSDVEYVQSLATSSLTFIALYTALQDRSRAWRLAALALVPVLSLATYEVRPENMFFVVVDVAAILLTAGRDVPLRRRVVVLAVVVGTGVYSFVSGLLVHFGHNVSEGLSWQTLQTAAWIVFDPNANTLLNPWITPPLVVMLAGAGLVVLVRSGHWRRAVYLFGWLGGFFIVHSYVVADEPAMMARYHMHLITPVLLLASAAFPLLTTAPRLVTVAFGVSLALSPFIHRSFITTDDFVIMREYEFVRANRALLPDDCTVLEYLPADSLTDPQKQRPGDSRLLRHGTVLDRGDRRERWQVVSLTEVREMEDGSTDEVLSREALDVLEFPPSCLAFLEGMTCRTHGPASPERPYACEDALRRVRVDTLAETTFPARIYDENNVRRVDGPPGIKAGDPVRIALHRLSKRLNERPPPEATTGVGE